MLKRTVLPHCHGIGLVESRSCRYGARYLAAILFGGDHVGVSVISELNPCPPVM